jgi:hypothetical protein
MFRLRINRLLDELGEVLDDFHHMGYEVLYYEKPKPHSSPEFKNVLQLTITLKECQSSFGTTGRRYDELVRNRKKDHEDYVESILKEKVK